MRLQEVFDKNWEHFVTKSSPPGYDPRKDVCQYFGNTPTGSPRRCAISVCFPADWDASTLGDSGHLKIAELAVESKPVARLFDGMDDAPLSLLQSLHDACAHKSDVSDFNRGYRAVLLQFADDFGLDIPESELVAA